MYDMGYIMGVQNTSPVAIAKELGERLKQARLNNDMTQSDVAALVGLTRAVVSNAEKGKAQLASFVAIMVALNLTEQLDRFLPKQDISPIQLSKLQGKKRQRASGLGKSLNEDAAEW